MSERAPYSRVYWSVRNDPRLVGIYSDDHHWATWNRLLVTADMAWPAPADLPVHARKASLVALEAAGVIELLPGGMFTFHGLDAERGRRRDAAVASATRSQTGRPPNGDRTVTERSASRVRDETSQDEPSIAREGLPNLTAEVARNWEIASGRTVLASGAFAQDYIDDACRRHPEPAIVAAIWAGRQTFNGSIPTTQQLTVAVRAILDPLPDSKRIDQEAREAERAAASDRATLATLVRVHRNGAHADDRHPRCPSCIEAAATA